MSDAGGKRIAAAIAAFLGDSSFVNTNESACCAHVTISGLTRLFGTSRPVENSHFGTAKPTLSRSKHNAPVSVQETGA
jgi:hypothetical protein